MNALDQFIKHELHCEFYLRYVDDLGLVHKKTEILEEWQNRISHFTDEKLGITLNPRATRLGPVSNGVDFAGFIIRQNYALVRRRVVGNLKAKLRQARPQLVRQTPEYRAWRFHPETLASCLAAVNSYLGHFKHAQSRRLIKKLWQEFSFLRHFFRLAKNKLTRIDQPLRRKSDLKQQVRWLQGNFEGHICLIQIGCYYEAFGTPAEKLAGVLGLSLRRDWRGFALACGFPQQHWPKMAAQLKKLQMPAVIVRQTGRELYHAKERLPALIVEYTNSERASKLFFEKCII